MHFVQYKKDFSSRVTFGGLLRYRTNYNLRQMVTVEIPLINEEWQMPADLQDNLYRKVFADPYNITYEFYDNWYNELSEEDRRKIIREKMARSY